MTERTEFVFPDEQEEKEGKVKPEKAELKDEIEIVDDTPAADRGRKPLDREVAEPTEEELAAYSDKVKERINELTHARHDERRRREQLEREVQEATRLAQALVEENRRYQEQLKEGTTTFVTQSKELAENRLNAAKAKLRAAHEAGDTDTFVEAQQEVALAVMALERAKSLSQPFLREDTNPDNVRTNAPGRTPVAPENRPQVVVDPRAQVWRNSNPWFGQDPEMTAFALGVHNKLVQNGVDTQSDDYYKLLNKRIRDKFPEAFQDTTAPEKSPPPTVVASASRSSSPKKIVLTKSQVSIANRLGVPLEMYARQLAKQQEQERNG